MRTNFSLLSGALATIVLGAMPVSAQYAGNGPPLDAYPHPVAYRFSDPSLIRADLVWESALQLVAVPVEGPDGRWVGRIRAIQPGPDGSHADRINIVLSSDASIWVTAWRIRYDTDAHVAFSDFTRDELWRMSDARNHPDPM
jgi:hypothetical protein